MTDKTKLNPEKQRSLINSQSDEQSETLSDSESRAKYGVNASRKSAISKRELMEELSRERFPWDE
jgi:hypothetical protein